MASDSQWLKNQTKDEFVVIPRGFVIALMKTIDDLKNRSLFEDIDDKCVYEKINTQWNFEEMKMWL